MNKPNKQNTKCNGAHITSRKFSPVSPVVREASVLFFFFFFFVTPLLLSTILRDLTADRGEVATLEEEEEREILQFRES
jgi:hypothetical protein